MNNYIVGGILRPAFAGLRMTGEFMLSENQWEITGHCGCGAEVLQMEGMGKVRFT